MVKPDETFLKTLKERAAGQEIARRFGIELAEVRPGYARTVMTCRPEMANMLGMIHGTAVFALIDEAFQASCNAHGAVAVALSMSLTFHHAPALDARLSAEAREIHAGRRTATYQITVTDEAGHPIASCQALAYRKDKPHGW